jgi:hypothetical protein
MNRGTQRSIVRIAPTRDGFANPSERLPQKHSGLLHGKTPDEWWALQSWSSELITTSILVAETQKHADRLHEQLGKYGIVIIPRPETMNHPSQDSGGFPTNWGYWWAQKSIGNIQYVIPDFVVNPLRKPGDYDRMIRAFDAKMCNPNPDAVGDVRYMTSAARTDQSFFRLDGERLMPQYQNNIGNSRFWPTYSTVGTLTVCTPEYYEFARIVTGAGTFHFFEGHPWLFEVEPWQEVHIDDQEQWDLAEFWMARKIGGVEAFEEYRKSWTEKKC